MAAVAGFRRYYGRQASEKAQGRKPRAGYHRGMWHMFRQTPEGFREASSLFQQAMELDKDFAPAFAAYVHCFARNLLMGPDQGDREKAVKAARREIELDNSDSVGEPAGAIPRKWIRLWIHRSCIRPRRLMISSN